jgi:hypothetical protein
VTSYAVEVDGPGPGITAEFERTDGVAVQFTLMPVPMGVPKTHPGAIVGMRLICEPVHRPPLCVILCSESGGCMRLESGGIEAVVFDAGIVSLIGAGLSGVRLMVLDEDEAEARALLGAAP